MFKTLLLLLNHRIQEAVEFTASLENPVETNKDFDLVQHIICPVFVGIISNDTFPIGAAAWTCYTSYPN